MHKAYERMSDCHNRNRNRKKLYKAVCSQCRNIDEFYEDIKPRKVVSFLVGKVKRGEYNLL